jgi:hypothetical protein
MMMDSLCMVCSDGTDSWPSQQQLLLGPPILPHRLIADNRLVSQEAKKSSVASDLSTAQTPSMGKHWLTLIMTM